MTIKRWGENDWRGRKVWWFWIGTNKCSEGIHLITNFTWSCLLAPIGKHTKTSFPSKSFFTACICIIYTWQYPSLAAAESMSDSWLAMHIFHQSLQSDWLCWFFGKKQIRLLVQSYPTFFPLHVAHSLSLRDYGILWVCTCRKYSYFAVHVHVTPDNDTTLAVVTQWKHPRLIQWIIYMLFVSNL